MNHSFLPVTHITTWENFLSILTDLHLFPKPCSFFNDDLIYFNYGRLIHQPSNKNYNWNVNQPVALFFSHRIFQDSIRCYPFDTGAILSGRLINNNITLNFLKNQNLEKRNPHAWLCEAYNSANEYLNFERPRKLDRSSRLVSILCDAYEQLNNSHGIDCRLTSIECQYNKPVSIFSTFHIIAPLDKENEIKKIPFKKHLNIDYYSKKSLDGLIPQDLRLKAENILNHYSTVVGSSNNGKR